MPENGPSPLVYVFPAVGLGLMVLYFAYGAIDRFGLETERAQARITGKRFAPGSTTYNTKVVAGQTLVDGTKNPDAYVLVLDLNGEPAGGAVTPELYQSLEAGDTVQVDFQRTRVSRQIVVTAVRRQ